MGEESKTECTALVEAEKKQATIRKKRDIFRFSGAQDMAINLEHVYKMIRDGHKITFQGSTADYVDFENEDAAKKAFDQILAVWCADVLE